MNAARQSAQRESPVALMAQCVQNKHATCPHGSGDGLTQSWRHTGQDLSDARESGVVRARRVDILSFVGGVAWVTEESRCVGMVQLS